MELCTSKLLQNYDGTFKQWIFFITENMINKNEHHKCNNTAKYNNRYIKTSVTYLLLQCEAINCITYKKSIATMVLICNYITILNIIFQLQLTVSI